MTKSVIYGKNAAIEVKANGVTGILCRSFDAKYFFRVKAGDGTFQDYDLRHDDLEVTISPNELASFYTIGDLKVLDHASEVLGLKQVVENPSSI
jgi:hypothetical protein